ncbi:unnamed protein product [Adineta steineri]|uniref:Peptidase S8/S53 domain-containing protein n=1 Tax=Adineta steineri TaxID=433720 RepID=A0A819AIV7_9BILA|nr:unnamed protein product [Adineta steineri]
MDLPSNQNRHASSVDNNNERARKYNVNRNSTPFYASKWFAIIMIVIAIGLLAVSIALAIALAIKSKSTDGSASATYTPTTGSTSATNAPTTGTTVSASQSFVLKCDPVISTNTKNQAETRDDTTQQTKMKLPVASSRVGNNILLKNTYIVEFPADVDVKNHFVRVTTSLKASNQIVESEIVLRHVISSSIFNGASFSTTTNDSIEAAQLIENAINIHPVYLVPGPRLFQNTFSSDRSINTSQYLINAFDLTGVNQVHSQFQNTGKGVRVAVIDTGVDYAHPALGGCFGTGCKVAFGYDFAGDQFSSSNPIPVPDNDPIDNCSSSSHGTHVAGIVGANINGINQTYFIPSVPFSGVAPDVTLGAYRVFGCPADMTTTDLVTAALYRAYDDKADIITISIGGAAAYTEDPRTIAIQRITNMGVYVTVALGNEGEGGLETVNMPGAAPDAMGIGSADSTYTLRYYIIAPDGSKIFYDPGTAFDPNGGANDGCITSNPSMNGTVVLFTYTAQDICSVGYRCNLAFEVGARGCLIYSLGLTTEGSYFIPTGTISLADGQRIISTVAANPSAIYTFTNLFGLSSMSTAGTPSSFSSLGLSGDLLIKPQITGIGGMVYSTISVSAAVQNSLPKPYMISSGTSMATPYVAGTLALFLASIGNPAPYTVSGYAQNGQCRPTFSLVKNIFQSTANAIQIYNSIVFATSAMQGAGLVNVYQAITAGTIFSPSELALNDTVRRATSYRVNVINIGNQTAIYTMSHSGAALATGKATGDDQLLAQPVYTADYADVTINPIQFTLQPGYSREITLQFGEPTNADPNLLPVFSGFIYATNQVNGEVTHLFYAGMVGDYGNAGIFVRNTTSGVITGIQKSDDTYVSEGELPSLNATTGIKIQIVLAWSTRVVIVQIIPANGTILIGLNVSSAVMFTDSDESEAVIVDPPRNAAAGVGTSFAESYPAVWNGKVVLNSVNGNASVTTMRNLNPGTYRIQFSALKHFGNPSNDNDFEVFNSPAFNLVF